MKLKQLISIFLISLLLGFADCLAQLKMSDDISLYRVADSVYMHTTFANHPQFGRFSSNGLVVLRNGKALLVDSPVTDEQTKQLVQFINDSLNARITHFVGCHWHEDCIGGLGYLNQSGVETICLELTRKICREKNLPVSNKGFTDSLTFSFEGIDIQCFYPGGGHTIDNIVVFAGDKKVLFGGCLIKSAESKNLGNLSDAVPYEWAGTIERVINRFTNAQIVVPGHGRFGGKELLSHTIQLVKTNYQKE
jgi:metallo-beta-lactamase class B